jgi:hypothetical protein
LLPKQ